MNEREFNDEWKALGRRYGSTMHQCSDCQDSQKKLLPYEDKGKLIFPFVQCANDVAGNKEMQRVYYRHFSKFGGGGAGPSTSKK